MNNSSIVGENHQHPFVDYIVDTPLTKQWKAFIVDRYNDNTNSNEHVIYVTQVSLYLIDDVVMCKAFPTTLKSPYNIEKTSLEVTRLPFTSLITLIL